MGWCDDLVIWWCGVYVWIAMVCGWGGVWWCFCFCVLLLNFERKGSWMCVWGLCLELLLGCGRGVCCVMVLLGTVQMLYCEVCFGDYVVIECGMSERWVVFGVEGMDTGQCDVCAMCCDDGDDWYKGYWRWEDVDKSVGVDVGICVVVGLIDGSCFFTLQLVRSRRVCSCGCYGYCSVWIRGGRDWGWLIRWGGLWCGLECCVWFAMREKPFGAQKNTKCQLITLPMLLFLTFLDICNHQFTMWT